MQNFFKSAGLFLQQGIQLLKENSTKKEESNNQYTESYEQNKDKINQLILLNVMSQLINVEEISQKQLEENEKNLQLITTIQEKLKQFLDDPQSANNQDELRDYFSFLHFKLTYFFSQNNKYEINKQNCSLNMKNLLGFLMTLKEKLSQQVNQKIQEIKDQLKTDDDQEIDFDNCYKQQEFTLIFGLQKEDKYSNYFKKFKLQDLSEFKFNGQLEKEKQFLEHLMDCYNIFGYVFLLKLMYDLQEKSCIFNDYQIEQSNDLINRSTVSLFKQWSQEKYHVSDCYFNKHQLQLYIDGFQSVLILSILPDLARFYNLDEPLPYQPTEINIGYIQQIIRGRRLYQKFPNSTKENIEYWQLLIQNMKKMNKQEDYEKTKIRLEKRKKENKTNKQMVEFDKYDEKEYERLEKCFHYKICELNLQALMNKNNPNHDTLEREKLLKLFLETVDASQYYNIKRKRQVYHTLSSLFINEEIILKEVIQLIKKSKIPYQSLNESQFFRNLVLSLKQEFNINTLINMNDEKSTSFQQQSNDSIFIYLLKDFMKAQQDFKKLLNIFQGQYLENELNDIQIQGFENYLKETKQQFLEIINSYGFLKSKKYNSLELNLQIYIAQINLIIDYLQQPIQQPQGQNENNQGYTNISQLSVVGQCQFEVSKVKTEQFGTVVMKQISQNDPDKNVLIQSQIREISILSKLPENNNIIQYKNYKLNGQKQFQLFLEYFEGMTLSYYLKKIKQLENQCQNFNKIFNQLEEKKIKIQKLNICIEILKATHFLHQQNIIHGDLKLDNILVSDNDQIKIKIIDFSESGFMIEKTLGFTHCYQDKSDFKSIYQDYVSIGVILIRLLYYRKFSYVCDCVCSQKSEQQQMKQQQYCKSTKFHKKMIMEKYKDKFKKDSYQKILFKQIKTLFNDQPYLRCSLIELIDLMKLQILEINKDNKLDNQQFMYDQKYGKIELKQSDTQNNPKYKIPINLKKAEEKTMRKGFKNSIENKQQYEKEDGQQNTLNNNKQLPFSHKTYIQSNSIDISKGIEELKLQYEQEDNQQKNDLYNLEKYFIDKEEDELQSKIFQRLKQIKFNLRKQHIHLIGFQQLTQSEKIYKIYNKFIGLENICYFLQDFIQILKKGDIQKKLIDQKIDKEIQNKISKYYKNYEKINK
ncbi:hypothetical protein ABPG74_016949 [Tetrahymena malaccensis]